MTLTDALAKHAAGTHSPKDIHDHIIPAAQWAADFPTDGQVEATAVVFYHSGQIEGDPEWPDLVEWVQEEYRTTARAALETVRYAQD